MPQIEVVFNRTKNQYYKNYALIDYAVSYSDNLENYKSTATVIMNFYIKPDPYTYTKYTSDSLSLGFVKDGIHQKTSVNPTNTKGKDVKSNQYNLIGSANFSVEYDSYVEKEITLTAEYQNMDTSRFAPFSMPENLVGGFHEYIYRQGNAVIKLEKRMETPRTASPVNFSARDSVFENPMVLSWGNPAEIAVNPSAGFTIEVRRGSTHQNFDAWVNLAHTSQSSFSYIEGAAAGTYLQYRIKTKSSLGDNFSSDWAYSSIIRKNSPPLAPLNVHVNKSSYTNGESLNVSWSVPEDIDKNILHYEIEYSVDGYNFSRLATSSTLSYSFIPTQAKDLQSIKFRVRAVDSLGAKGQFKESISIMRNDLTGINLAIGGQYKKANIYVCKGNEYKKASVYVARNGSYVKGVN